MSAKGCKWIDQEAFVCSCMHLVQIAVVHVQVAFALHFACYSKCEQSLQSYKESEKATMC